MEKPPFEQVLTRVMLENLVRQDLRKEAALKKAYGVEVTPAMLDAEVQRINTTTSAPEILAEIVRLEIPADQLALHAEAGIVSR